MPISVDLDLAAKAAFDAAYPLTDRPSWQDPNVRQTWREITEATIAAVSQSLELQPEAAQPEARAIAEPRPIPLAGTLESSGRLTDSGDSQTWSGHTAALGGRVAVEAKELLAPLAKAYGLKTERAVIEKLIIDAARAKLPDGPPAR